MHNSRYPSEAPFTRRDGMPRYDMEEEDSTVELFVKFRTFRPYLKKRLGEIYKDGRERELKDEVEDIEYYLIVMSDMCADDNHGGDALQGFIDRIHEMIRKNPSSESRSSSHNSPGDKEDDIDQERPPRSPSPEVIDSDDAAPARPIPLEREQRGKEFSYFASLEESLANRSKSGTISSSDWVPESEAEGGNDTYRRRGSYQDIDMRGESRYKPMENSGSLGRGTSVSNHSRRWEGDSGRNSTFGRGAAMDDSYRDRDERSNRSYNSRYEKPSERFHDSDRSNNWRESTNWNSTPRGMDSSRRNEDFERPRGRRPSDHQSRQPRYEDDRTDTRFNWDRQYQSAADLFPPTELRNEEPQRTFYMDEPLFERRPEFERRRQPSGENRREPIGSVQIDYNHGGGATDESWDGTISSGRTGLDKDMRGAVPQLPTFAGGPGLFGTDPFNPAHQEFLKSVQSAAIKAYLPNVAAGFSNMNSMLNAAGMQQNVGVPNVGMQPNINVQELPHLGFNNMPMNSRPGLLPTPAGTISEEFLFRNPSPPTQRATRPQPPENFHPGNDPAAVHRNSGNSNTSSSHIREIMRQKAQQCFSRPSPRKDNQNVPPMPRNQTNTPATSLPPPSNAASQGGMLASNQLLSDRDPRLQKLKKNNSTNHPSQNDTAAEPRRAENVASRQGTKSQDENRDRSAGTHQRLDRPDYAPLDPRRRPGRFEPVDIAPSDPRGAKIREERARVVPSDPRLGKNRSEPLNRNTTTDPRGSFKSRDDSRERNARTAVDDSQSNSRKLNDIRDRVRANINISAPKPVMKPSKLQEIRKQVEKEGYHALGRQTNKKNASSFDEALNPRIEKSPPRVLVKPSNKSKSRDTSIEKGSKNLVSQKAVKEKIRDVQAKKKTEKMQTTRGRKGKETEDSPKGVRKRVRSKKNNQPNYNSASEDNLTPIKPPEIGPRRYRIPKIKKPDPIPIPAPPQESSHSGKVTESWAPDESSSYDLAQVTDDDAATSVSDTNGHIPFETEELVKRFILQSVTKEESDAILKDSQSIISVVRLLKEQVKLILNDEPHLSSSLWNSQVSGAAATDETPTELPSESLSTIESKDTEDDKIGTHRSRSTTRKKSAKRRSSLEKLHDALQEMGFDADLPLGPRKCTRAPVKPNEALTSSATAVTNERSPQIVLNKDDLNNILANRENKDSNNIADNETAADAEVVNSSVPGRRGRKRKRKGSKLKPNKKKKGPVTRAQAAVKTALKHHQKDQGKSGSSESTDSFNRSKRKRASQARGSKTEGRVTRSSMLGRTSIIVSNLGLDKIKIESDYIPPPKIEPEDHNDEDSITAGSGYEHLEGGGTGSDNLGEKSAGEFGNQTNFMEYPSDMDFQENEDDDRMSVDIKSEKDYDGVAEEDVQQAGEVQNELSVPDTTENELEPNQNVLAVIKPEPEPEPDTDYETDLSFLPDIPRIEAVYSLTHVVHKDLLDKLYAKMKEDEEDEVKIKEEVEEEIVTQEIECARNSSLSCENECRDLVQWMVSTIEYQLDDSYKVAFQSQLTNLSNISPINFLEICAPESTLGNNISDDEEGDEPNDFYIIVDNSEDEEEYESNCQTESDIEDATDTPLNNTPNSEEQLFEINQKSDADNVPSILRNNLKTIYINRPHHLFGQGSDEHKVPIGKSKLFRVKRAGDGYQNHVLTGGYVSPTSLDHQLQKRMTDQKLGHFLYGCRISCFKKNRNYWNMLREDKIIHFFKCMGTYCSYSGESKEEFLDHLKTHYNTYISLEAETDIDKMDLETSHCSRFIPYEEIKNSKDWNGCCYCSLNFKTPEDLVDHVVNQHNQCIYQCAYCFYRAYYQRYVLRHSESDHPKKSPRFIKCTPRSDSDWIESEIFRIFVYICPFPSCRNNEEKRFVMRGDFINHLKMCSPSLTSYPCHICLKEFPLDMIIEHYKCHMMFNFHCSYCPYGSEEKIDIELHFYTVHPNVMGRVYTRDPKSSGGRSEVTESNSNPDKTEPPIPMETNDALAEIETSAQPVLAENTITQKDVDGSNSINETVYKDKMLITKQEDGINGVKELKSQYPIVCSDEDEDDEENKEITNLEGQDLYRCANLPCIFKGVNAALFKDHVTTCIFVQESKQVGCFHCDKRVKAIPNLLEHMKVHGRKKQLCSLCNFKTWIHSELTRHMKTTHKVYNYKVEKIEVEGDEEPDMMVIPKEVACRIISLETLKENFSRYADKLVFGPEDIDKVPARHIFHTLAYCSLCSYSTKVRVNIIRHLKFHNSTAESEKSIMIPESDPVNPVPCLERKELMFDKMTNWAGSTHAHKPGPSASSDISKAPAFVVDQFRYVCSVKGCHQITTDDVMLRTHMRALHPQVDIYRCPHCYKSDVTRKDVRNTVPVDKLGNHLKLHGGKLYRCNYCDYVHQTPLGMEKHLPEKHPEKKPIHYLIRNVDANGVLVTRMSDDEENASASGKWRCNICNSKSLFSTHEEAKEHCSMNHRVYGQFICAYCRFYTSSDKIMEQHVERDCCEKISEEGQVMVMWVRNEFADTVKPEDTFHGPLWKRSSQSVKHIRGIFLEDFKDMGGRTHVKCGIDITPVLSSITGAGSGKKSSGKLAESTTKIPQTVTSSSDPSSPIKSQILFVCPKCNKYKTKNRQDMTVHLFNELGYQRYGCPQCDYKFVTENSLKGHYSGDHGLIYDEKLCQLLPVNPDIEDFIRKYYAEQEELAKPSESLEGRSLEGQLLCKHCRHPCNSYHNLRTHILAKHIASDRYKCNYCPLAFYSEGLGYNHIKKTHPDMPLALTEDAELQSKLTPEFWMEEYGIPTKKIPEKKHLLLPALYRDGIGLVDTDGNYKCPHCNFTTEELSTLDAHVEEYHTDETALSPNSESSKNIITTPFSPTMNFLDAILGDIHIPEDQLPGSKINRKENANVYKCFHCMEACFTVRGARSHWKKVHLKIPEERCIYYEFRAFDDSMQLPRGMELWCSHCDYKVSSMIYMQSHHQTFHPTEVFRMKRRNRVGTVIYTCSHCYHECSEISELEEHNDLRHPDTPIEYSKVAINTVEIFEKDCFGKLIEDAVRYCCIVCKKEFNARQECKNHQRSYHLAGIKEPTLKYNRKVLNPRVKVPKDGNDQEAKPKFKCPKCSFTSEDKQRLITDHLPHHIPYYLCPICDSSFQTFLEAKFHIRHNHSAATRNPLINPRLCESREDLEKGVSEVKCKRKIDSKIVAPAKVIAPAKVHAPTKVIASAKTIVPAKVRLREAKRPALFPPSNNPSIGSTEAERRAEDDDDDVIIENVVIVNRKINPTNTYGRENGKFAAKKTKMRDLPTQGTSTKQRRVDNSPWNLFEDEDEDYMEFPKLKCSYSPEAHQSDEKDDEPDLIEIPAANSGIQWDLDCIPEFSRIGDSDAFMNPNSFNWEDLEEN